MLSRAGRISPVTQPSPGSAANGSVSAVSQCGSAITSSSVKATTDPSAAATPVLCATASPGVSSRTYRTRSAYFPVTSSYVSVVRGALSTTISS